MKAGISAIAWAALLCCLGVVTAGVQLDRATKQIPALATRVPAVFRVNALTSLIGRDPAALSRQKTVELIAARPIPAEHLALLTLVELQRGDEPAADKAMRMSAARGWRVAIAQLYVMRLALLAGDWPVAAQRYDALRRVGGGELTPQDLASFLGDPAGRSALAEQFPENGVWTSELLREDSRTQDPADFVRFVQLLRRRGVDFDCPALQRAAVVMLARHRPSDAGSVWTGPCAAHSVDPSAVRGLPPPLGQAGGPFDWVYPNNPGVTRSFLRHDGRWYLKYANDDPLRRPLAQRVMTLAPGAHRWALQAEPAAEGADAPSLRIVCAKLELNIVAPDGTISVPGAGCDYQIVQIDVPAGEGRVTLSID